MNEILLTPAQLQASDPIASAWVSANAGTGKTKVLCDRVLRLLLDGTLPSRILCITFTKAAAAEMQIRIHTELAQWVGLDDVTLKAKLNVLTGTEPGSGLLKQARMLFAKVIDAPGGIRIDTIHAFCQSLLRRFPTEAGIQPHFQVIDETTAAELMGEATQRLYQRATRDDPALGEAIAFVAGRMSEGKFSELLGQMLAERRILVRSLMATGDFDAYLNRLRALFNVSPDETAALLTRNFLRETEKKRAALLTACHRLLESSPADKKLGAGLQVWLATEEPTAENILRYVRLYLTQWNLLRKQLVTKPFRTAFPSDAELLEEEAQDALEYFQKIQNLELIDSSTAALRIADTLLDLYRHLKDQRSAMDYDDLILAARNLLHTPDIAPWVLYKLDGGLDHLLVDEAQDTSLEQWEIIEALTSEFFSGDERVRTLFVVGDEKQSIYSFQGAEPQAFEIKRRIFSEMIQNAQRVFYDLKLDRSFRSTERVLQAVDQVFALPTAHKGLSLSGTPVEHTVHRVGQPGRVEVWPLIPTAEVVNEADAWHRDGRSEVVFKPPAMLAHHLADTIQSWLAERRLLNAKERVVRPGDILILVRKRTAIVSELTRALKRRGIPVAGVDRLRVREHIAVMDLTTLGAFLLMPEDDLTLACVLKSPLFGIDEEQLFTLSYRRGTTSLWERLQSSRDKSSIEAADYLRRLLSMADYVTPYALFARVLEADGGRHLFATRLGEEANDPIDEFLSLALNYTCNHSPSLQGFIHWLEYSRLEIKRDSEQKRDEVRIMTVHGAKGLQAPIVILPDTASQIRGRESAFLWHENKGISFLLWPTGIATSHPVVLQLKETRRERAEEEYRRLLYVALTRAEDELYVYGIAGKRETPKNHWHALVTEGVGSYAAASETEWFGSTKTVWRTHDEEHRYGQKTLSSAMPLSLSSPHYLISAPPAEPFIPVPLVPSRVIEPGPDLTSPIRSRRITQGIHAHRLLQLLPEISPSKWINAADAYLERFASGVDVVARRKIAAETIAVLQNETFHHVFGPGSLAEVPISGLLKGKTMHILSGQIDRIAILENEVIIVDFKTGTNVPSNIYEVPKAYLRQMQLYQRAIKSIYPDKKVTCALLWTAIPLLMPLTAAVLDDIQPR